MTKRRQFLKSLVPFSIAPSLLAQESKPPLTICLYTEQLVGLNYNECADAVAELGVTHIEATVRGGGQVLPERVADDLPKFVDALKKRNVAVGMIATDVKDAHDATSRKVLETAATLGIQNYRMSYFRYDLSKPIKPQLEALKPQLAELIAFGKELGITAHFQNHAGADVVGAPIWDVDLLMEGYDPKDFGIGFDIRHAMVEGGTSWPVQLQLMRDHLASVFVQDFRWEGRELVKAPLGKGNVDPKFISMLKKMGWRGLICLRSEYVNAPNQRALATAFLKAAEQDLKVLRGWIALH